ncbi:MAG TPA: membrane protein insertion efficiency factor YidD [Burkholderiaceae bacterium]
MAPRRALVALVRLYRLLLSPWIGGDCRFTPTCSAYAIEALERHGALAGSGLAAWRVLRCNPWCHGGCDPVPDNARRRRVADDRRPSAGQAATAGLFSGLLAPDAGDPPAVERAEPSLSKTSP